MHSKKLAFVYYGKEYTAIATEFPNQDKIVYDVSVDGKEYKLSPSSSETDSIIWENSNGEKGKFLQAIGEAIQRHEMDFPLTLQAPKAFSYFKKSMSRNR